jgi:nicotinamide mononucleotide transporter
MLETLFTLFGTPVSRLEALASALSLACVVCNVWRWPVTWPLTITASALYAWLLYQSKLYGSAGVQIVFIAMAFWGWWQWVYARDGASQSPLTVKRLRPIYWPWLLVIWLAMWLPIGSFLKGFTNTDVPWWDGFVTAGSLIGTWLLARKLIETWPVWLIVNALSVALFATQKLAFTAILYAIFFVMAVWGWLTWRAEIGQK